MRRLSQFCPLLALASVLVTAPTSAEMTGARIRFGESDTLVQTGRSLCLKTEIIQTSGDWLVIEPYELACFQPANAKGRLVREEGSLSGAALVNMKELGWRFSLSEAGEYDVWLRAKFPLAAGYNHGERMDDGEVQRVSDSADAAKVDKYGALPGEDAMRGKWLEPKFWHWYKNVPYALAAGPHFFHWPADGAWNAGCLLDRMVLVRKGSSMKPEEATKVNRRIARATSGEIVSGRIKTDRLTAWSFEMTADAGDGKIDIAYAIGEDPWQPFEAGCVYPAPADGRFLRFRIRLTAAVEGIPPVVYDYKLKIQKKETDMKTPLVATAALCTSAALAGIQPLRIVPNKIVYAVGEKGWADVVLTNTSDKAERAALTVSDLWDVSDESREIFRDTVALAPHAGKTLKVDWPGSTVRYGHEIKVQVEGCKLNVEGLPTPNSQLSTRSRPSRSEYFNVIDEWWRVNQGCDMETNFKGICTPQAARLCRYYGYATNEWISPWMPYIYQTHAKRMPGMGPFIGYFNMVTRWHIEQSSVGGNYACSQYPKDQPWSAITGEGRTNRAIDEDTAYSHARGIRHTHFTINYMEGPHGFELARKKPHYVLRNDRGQYVGLYMDPQIDPTALARLDRGFSPWTFVEPNFFREDVLEWALDDLKKGIDAYGEDGVYFDGRYMKNSGFDFFGNNLAKTHDVRATVSRNMRRTHEVLLKNNPQRFIWSNGCGPGSSGAEHVLLDHPRSGLLDETQWKFLIHPTMSCNTYRGFLDGLVNGRNVCYVPSKTVPHPAKIYIVGYLSSWWTPPPPEPDRTRERWAMGYHAMALLASTLAHPFAASLQTRPFKQMMTRYSDLFWHEDIEVMKDGYKRFICDSQREVWYDDMIYKRETKDHTDYYIHLVNSSEQEFFQENLEVDPPVVDDAEVSTKLFGAEGVKAWVIKPYGYTSQVLEPTCEPVIAHTVAGETVFKIPPFDYYTLLVIRVAR